MTDYPFDFFAAPQFESVKDAFVANFTEGLEHGAAFCVFQHGERIIDFKGGWADRKKTRPLTDNSLIAVYSSGKAVAALVLAMLADDDRFSYDQPIETIWPQFAAHGKGGLTIAQLLSHQSGLSGITNPYWTLPDWYNWNLTCEELALQKPIFKPGSQSGYSPITYGFLAGEIARLTDEHGRHLGQILREDICVPHNLDIWIGLPESEHGRCADMKKPRKLADLGEINDATKAAFMEPWSSPGRHDPTAWRKAQMAGSNCHANARSLAKLMQMAVDGNVGGEKYLAEGILSQLKSPRISGRDQVLPFQVTFAAGLMHNEPNYFYGPHAPTVGHSGWGGSCVFADPETGISAAYVMTQQGNSLMGDPRPVRIINALYDAL